MGEDKPTESSPDKFRIVGLFSREREVDLQKAVALMPGVKLASVDFDSAEVTLQYDLQKLFPESKSDQAFPAKQVLEQLDNALRKTSNSTFTLHLPLATAKAQLVPVELTVGVLDCKGCCLAVYEIVAKIEGVERATVAGKTGLVVAWIHPEKTNRAALEAALMKSSIPLISKPTQN